MANQTPLHAYHCAAGARMVDFAGWEMPLHYGSQLEEHHVVRQAAGMFDVSHMAQFEIRGTAATEFLQHVFANDAGRIEEGQALYGCLLNEEGGVIDDGIVYRFAPGLFRLVTNAATRERVAPWLSGHAEAFGVDLRERDDIGMIAVQGPQARDHVHALLTGDLAAHARKLRRFRHVAAGQTHVARTGYTGEDGYEVTLPAAETGAFWEALAERGVAPVGLGARDTLRLEAGLALYGHEMDEATSPLEAALGWTVAWEPAEREFIGRAALEKQRAAGVAHKLVGFGLSGRGVARAGQNVHTAAGDGVVTSGGFAPTLERSIGLARVPAEVALDADIEIEIRGRRIAAQVERFPFVRKA
jgi:aminomethyltransferase